MRVNILGNDALFEPFKPMIGKAIKLKIGSRLLGLPDIVYKGVDR